MSRLDKGVLLLILAVFMFASAIYIRDHGRRLDRLECVHYVYEDGSAVHEDAERASRCLEQR